MFRLSSHLFHEISMKLEVNIWCCYPFIHLSVKYSSVINSTVHWSSQTGELTRDRPAFSGFGSSSSYNSSKVTRSRITTVTLSIELIEVSIGFSFYDCHGLRGSQGSGFTGSWGSPRIFQFRLVLLGVDPTSPIL